MRILGVQGEKGIRSIRESQGEGSRMNPNMEMGNCVIFKDTCWAHSKMGTVLEEDTEKM